MGPDRDTEPGAAARARVVRDAQRASAALGVALAVVLVLWKVHRPQLVPPIDIVGYPTFEPFNFHPAFYDYRLAVWAFPICFVLALAVLWRWGPLSAPGPVSRPALGAAQPADQRPPVSDSVSPRMLWWLAPTAFVVAWAVSSRANDTRGALTLVGVVAGLSYLAVVSLAAAVLAASRRGSLVRAMVQVNAPLGAVAGAASYLLWVRGTEAVHPSGAVDRWPWIPLWFGAVVVLAVAAAQLVAMARGAAPGVVHRAAGLGSAAVVLVVSTSFLEGPVGPINGFDDMMSVAGADLLTRGYFPWRDVLFIHGPFEDGLRSWAGFKLFEPTVWGANATMGMIWQPLGWLSIYLLGVWTVRGRGLPSILLLGATVYASTQLGVPFRWCVAALVFLLLGETLRRGSTRWAVVMTVALFLEAVLVPEAAFQVLAVVMVIVAHDLVTRPPGRSWWAALALTRPFVATGALLTAAWAGFLGYHSSLSAFVEYYAVFGPGHAESGALPLGPYASTRFLVVFCLMVALVVVTLLVVGYLWVARRPIGPLQWLLLGCAVMAGLYGEKGLARPDDGHLLQSIYIALPLAVVWLGHGLVWGEDALQARRAKRAPGVPEGASRVWSPAAAAYCVVLVVALIALPPLRHAVWHAPSADKVAVGAHRLPGVGYSSSDPGSYDPDTLADLRTVIDTYAPGDAGFFDFTNDPGLFYYLLGEDPTTPYYHVSMAVPEFAQQDVVDRLEERPPALVAFDSRGTMGLPSWDLVSNETRHFEISRYLLSGWTPVLQSHGVLFLLRNDLVATAPPVPRLTTPAVTRDLYFTSDSCDWGAVPNFLSSSLDEPVTVDLPASRQAREIRVGGWAVDPTTGAAPTHVYVTAGTTVVAVLAVDKPRPDVVSALGGDVTGNSGFDGLALTDQPGQVHLYAEYADGQVLPLGGHAPATRVLTLPDGGRLPVADGRPAEGSVDAKAALKGRMTRIEVPDAVALADVAAAEFSSDGKNLGTATYVLTDSLVGRTGQYPFVEFRALPSSGDHMTVRVGSCLQWHGYDSGQLYLFKRHGPEITSMRLATSVRD